MTDKPISIKGSGCKSSGCAPKAGEFTPGDLAGVSNAGLRDSRGSLTACRKSAEGMVGDDQRRRPEHEMEDGSLSSDGEGEAE
jgi:hypothetical protein